MQRHLPRSSSSASRRSTFAVALGLVLLSGCSRGEQSSDSKNAFPKASAQEAPLPPSAQPTGQASQDGVVAKAPGTAAPSTVLGQATDAAGDIRLVRGEELAEHLRTTKARGTIVNIWASWCGPCRRELPMLIGLASSLSAQGIQLVFVSVDEPESEQAALAFFREQGGKAPIYVAEQPLGPFKQALSPRWRGMLPATFLFDAGGALRYLWGGPVYDTELLPIVDGFLAGKNIDGESNFGLAPGQDSRH